MPRASYARHLSAKELRVLDALTDAQKLAVGHAMRLGARGAQELIVMARRDVAAGSGHECSEWLMDKQCALCDRKEARARRDRRRVVSDPEGRGSSQRVKDGSSS